MPTEMSLSELKALLRKPHGIQEIYCSVPFFDSAGGTLFNYLANWVENHWYRYGKSSLISSDEFFDEVEVLILDALNTAIHNCADSSKLPAYLRRVVQNSCFTVLRRQPKKQRAHNAIVAEFRRVQDFSQRIRVPRELLLREDEAMEEKRRKLIQGWLAELADRYPQRAAVLRMRYMEGCSAAEILEKLRMPESTYYYNLAAALEQLREYARRDRIDPRDILGLD